MNIFIPIIVIVISTANVTFILTTNYYKDHTKINKDQCILTKPVNTTCEMVIEWKPVEVE